MGRDKGLIETNGKPWARIALEKLNAVGVNALVSVNPHQVHEYQLYFNKQELILDRADLRIQGPLIGVLSTYLSHPEDIVVLACDMINMEPFILKRLLEEYQQNNAEAIAFKGENVEPLCAIYSARSLRKIKSLYDAGSLENHSMKNILEIVESIYLPINEDWRPLFKNSNSLEELN